MKTATLESKFPLLAVENGCIISKDADITVAYRVELPELFTLTRAEYESMRAAAFSGFSSMLSSNCMMDEIGKLHPNNISGILKFANDRNIILINGSPTELNRDAYKHVYLLTKGTQNKTRIARLISDKQL